MASCLFGAILGLHLLHIDQPLSKSRLNHQYLHLVSGLPILYLVTAVSFSLQYWVEKAELLKLSKRPAAYGPDLARMAGNLLPYATLWHLAFATWSFSFYKTSRSPLVSESSVVHVEWFLKLFYWIFDGDGVEVDAGQHANRMLQRNAAHHLVGAILIGLVLLAKVQFQTQFVNHTNRTGICPVMRALSPTH